MPAANLTIVESISTITPAAGNTIAYVGVASAGTEDTAFSFTNSTTVATTLTSGPLPDILTQSIGTANQPAIGVRLTGSVAGTISSVTESPAGSGPTVTVTGTPTDTYDVAVRIVTGGAVGVSRFKVALDGETFGPEIETAATYVVPGSGLTIGFPAGVYVAGTDYTATTVAPYYAVADVDAAVDALLTSGLEFSIVAVVGQPATAADARTLANALSAAADRYATAKRYVDFFMEAPVDATDADLKAAFATFIDRRVTVFAGDAYMYNSAQKATLRRSSMWPGAVRAAKARFSSDLGNGQDGPLDDVVAITRNEFGSATPLRPFRFTVLETRPGLDGFYFARGVTMAQAGSVYADLNLERLINIAARQVQADLNREVNNDPPTTPQGTIDELVAEAMKKQFENNLKILLLDPEPPHASRVQVTIDTDDVIATTKDLKADFVVQQKSQIHTVSGRLGFQSVLTVEG